MGRLVAEEVFRSKLDQPAAGTAVRVRVRELDGQAVWLRPRSYDRTALEFLSYGYHLPPADLPGPVGHIAVLGANIGLLLAGLAGRYPHARLLGAGPDRDNAALARRNLAHLGVRCTLAETAVWHRDETLTLSWQPDTWGQRPSRNRSVAAAPARRCRSTPGSCSASSAARPRSTTYSSTSSPPGTRCSNTESGLRTSAASRSRSRTTTTRRSHCSRHSAIRPGCSGSTGAPSPPGSAARSRPTCALPLSPRVSFPLSFACASLVSCLSRAARVVFASRLITADMQEVIC
jgi:hypothetical protein